MNVHHHRVLKSAITQKAAIDAHVTLDTYCTVMEDLVLVCISYVTNLLYSYYLYCMLILTAQLQQEAFAQFHAKIFALHTH